MRLLQGGPKPRAGGVARLLRLEESEERREGCVRPCHVARGVAVHLVCAQDNGTPPARQRDQAKRAGRAVELSVGHHPFLSQPQAVADLILDLTSAPDRGTTARW